MTGENQHEESMPEASATTDTAKWVPPAEPLAIEIVRREVQYYLATRAELRDLAENAASVHLAFFGLTVGTAVTILVALLTTTISDRVFGAFVMVLVATVIFAGWFGYMAWRTHQRTGAKVEEITRRTAL